MCSTGFAPALALALALALARNTGPALALALGVALPLACVFAPARCRFLSFFICSSIILLALPLKNLVTVLFLKVLKIFALFVIKFIFLILYYNISQVKYIIIYAFVTAGCSAYLSSMKLEDQK